MKYSIDVNIFLYATNTLSPLHTKALDFIKKQIQEQEQCYLLWDTLYSFLRIATHPSIFEPPLTPEHAIHNMTHICEALKVEFISPDETSWEYYLKLTQLFPIKGNLVPDAVLASTLTTRGITRLYTHDRDFWKFPNLKPVDPFA